MALAEGKRGIQEETHVHLGAGHRIPQQRRQRHRAELIVGGGHVASPVRWLREVIMPDLMHGIRCAPDD
jgi:hypothetical protein